MSALLTCICDKPDVQIMAANGSEVMVVDDLVYRASCRRCGSVGPGALGSMDEAADAWRRLRGECAAAASERTITHHIPIVVSLYRDKVQIWHVPGVDAHGGWQSYPGGVLGAASRRACELLAIDGMVVSPHVIRVVLPVPAPVRLPDAASTITGEAL
ncbi:hypothetical protein P7L78_22085 [Tistrella bauzanensis]|uniref:hypothetical protein n=1 Tax=Tistrella TaxID=171436 RepID=UPI0031F6128D